MEDQCYGPTSGGARISPTGVQGPQQGAGNFSVRSNWRSLLGDCKCMFNTHAIGWLEVNTLIHFNTYTGYMLTIFPH